MLDRIAAIAAVEDLLRRARDAYDTGALNVSKIEVDRTRQKLDLSNSPWKLFVLNADYSYFVSRVLLSQGVHLYGLFCAHQCVEVYLKALLRHEDAEVPQHHKLRDILTSVRALPAMQQTFVQTDYADTVCLRFDPFYEIARYPVQRTRPEGGKWAWASGVDEVYLDYFVLRMRELLVLPDGEWDILSEQGHFYLQLVREHHPEFFDLFTRQNINFAR